MLGMVIQIHMPEPIAELTKYRWTYSVEIRLPKLSSTNREEFKIEFSFKPSPDKDWPVEIIAKRIYDPGEEEHSITGLLFEQGSWLSNLIHDPQHFESATLAAPVDSRERFVIFSPYREVAEILERSSKKLAGGMVRDWMSTRFKLANEEQVITVDRMVAPDGMPVFADIITSSSNGPGLLIRLTQLSRKARR